MCRPWRRLGGDRRQDDVVALEERAEGPRGRVEHRLHRVALGIGRVQPALPDLDIDRLQQIGGRLIQTELRQMTGDHLREITDVAGRLRSECVTEIHLRQCPFHVMAEPFEHFADTLQLRNEMRRRFVVAPLMRQRDAQSARVALDQLAIGLGRRPERHEFAGSAAAAIVDEGSGVAHAAADAALDRDQPGEIRQRGRQRIDAARDLQTDQAVHTCGNADRTTAIRGVGDRACTPAATIAAEPAEEPQVV